VCQGITPIANRVALLILQHPQEQDVDLGTARLTALHFKTTTLKVGLSWANLGKILGRTVDPKRWGVLYLGPARGSPGRDLTVVDKRGDPEPDQDALLGGLEGLIALDGTWSQAKTLWWRNPWLLKCRRIVVTPKGPSRYGTLRKQPRREGLSTLEAVALAMARLEKNTAIEPALTATFDRLLKAYGAQSP
jgi:DTW domain-containing protein YfiP